MTAKMYTGQDVFMRSTVDDSAHTVTFNHIDEFGNRWVLTDVDGWWGLPDATAPEDARPFQEDGNYFATGRYEARQLTISGFIVPGRTPEEEESRTYTNAQTLALRAASARNSLNRAMNLIRSTGILQVNETLNGGPKIAAVQLVAKPLTKFNDIRNVLEFNFQLRAADPRKYSADTIIVPAANLEAAGQGRTYDRDYNYTYGSPGSDGMVTVTNAGSYNTFGVIRINGPVIHPSIEHVELGRTISIDLSLGEDEYLEINLKDKTILLNGTASRRNRLDPSSKWFWFFPGDNTLRFTGYQVNEPRPEYPAAENLATNPSFETAFGETVLYTNESTNPRALGGLTEWPYVPGTSEVATTVAAGTGTTPAGVEVRRNYSKNPQAVGPVVDAVDGYGGSIDNFGSFIDGTDQLTAVLVPGSAYVTRTNYARDPRASQGYSVAGAGWTYEPGAGEDSVSVSVLQNAVTRENLYRNPKFAAPEDSSVPPTFTATSDEDVFLGTCFAINRTDGLGVSGFSAGLKNVTYAASTEYTVSFKVRVVGQATTGATAVEAYLRPVGPSLTNGEVLLGEIDQEVGDPQTYSFTVTTSSEAPVVPSIALVVPAAWGDIGATIMVSDVLVETGQTDGSFFWGDSAEIDLPLERHVAYRWTGVANASTSEQVESLQQDPPGPDGEPGFIRQYIIEPETSGLSGWTYHDLSALLPAESGDTATASLYVRSTSPVNVRLDMERRLAGASAGAVEAGTAVELVPDVWTRVDVLSTATATSDQFFARLEILDDVVSSSLPRGTLIDVSGLLVERGASVGSYFDGSFPDIQQPFDRTVEYSWAGTPGDSASTVSETITPTDDSGTSGPIDAVSSFARAVVAQPKTAGISGWAGRDATHAMPVAIASGERVTVSIYTRYVGSDATLPVSLRLEFQSTAGTAAATTDASVVNLPSGEWVRLSVSALAAASYTHVGWSIRNAATDGAPADSTLDVSGLLIERPGDPGFATPDEYFDGDSTDVIGTIDQRYVHTWAGTVAASASVESLTASANGSGPLGAPGYARTIVTTARTAGVSQFEHVIFDVTPPIPSGVAVTASMYVRSSANVIVEPVITLSPGGDTAAGTLSPGLGDDEWHRISATITTDSEISQVTLAARLNSGQVLGVSDVIDLSSALIERDSGTVHGYFDGGFVSSGVEGVSEWEGTANDSRSLLSVLGVKLFGSVSEAIPTSDATYQTAQQSTSWSFIGGSSLRHQVTSSPTEETYVLPHGTSAGLVRLGMEAGEPYTVSVYLYVPEVQTGTLSTHARTIALEVTGPGGATTVYSDQAPNAVGVYRLSLSTTLPGDTTDVSLQLFHGATQGTLYWDGVMVESGLSMSADYFDGDSSFGVWAGTPQDSVSTRPFIPEVRGATAEIMTRSAWIE